MRNKIDLLLRESNGKAIAFGTNEYIFERKEAISEEEISDFEKKFQVKFPEFFKEFLVKTGACSLFKDNYASEIEFLHPKYWESYSHKVFEGTGQNLFPKITLLASVRGEQAGFLTCENDAFAVFYSEIPPEYWQDDSEFSTFETWLKNEINQLENL